VALALLVVTIVYATMALRALRAVSLTVPFGDRQGFLAQVTAEIQRVGYPAPKSQKNALVFQSAKRGGPVVVTTSEASATITCPPPIRVVLKTVFPGATDQSAAKLRVQSVVTVIAVWLVIVMLVVGVTRFH